MKKYYLLFSHLLFFLLNINIYAQNLVPNHSFEEGRPPDKYSGMIYVQDWGKYSNFSSDYYSANAYKIPENYRMNNMGIPYNESGFQNARTGISYAGLAFSREIIQCQLIDSLIKDSIYEVAFFTNLANNSKYAIWRLGAYLSKKPIVYDGSYNEVFKAKPQILNDSLNYITDTLNWIEIAGYYKASGGEKYLSIGSFSKNDNERKIVIPDDGIKNNNLARYYYIDDVSIEKVNLKDFNNIKNDTIINLSKLQFNNDKISFTNEAFAELELIVGILKSNPKFAIEIYGHTDNVGLETYNQPLSENRAKAVSDYLISKGIDKSRVSYKGYGSSRPIASNDTDEGRAKNRRVEIKILKNKTN